MSQQGWAKSVARELKLKEALNYTSMEGSRVMLHLPCTTCDGTHDENFARHYPPEIIRKHLHQRGWNTDKRPKLLACAPLRVVRKPQEPVENVMSQLQKITRGNKSVSFTVNKDSDLFKHFVGDDFKSTGYWSMEISHDSNGRSKLIVSRADPPAEGKQREAGKGKGSYLDKQETYVLQMSESMIPGIDEIIEFSATPVDIASVSGKHIVLDLPDNVRRPPKPVMASVIKKNEPEPSREVKTPIATVQPAPEPAPVSWHTETSPAPAPQRETLVAPKPRIRPEVPPPQTERLEDAWNRSHPKQSGFRSPVNKHDIGLYYAVDIVNYYKSIMGDNMQIEVRDGKLVVLAEYGG